MRLQKKILIWSGTIATVALVLSFLLYRIQFEYMSNICIGLFSSGILICVTSTVSYFYERNVMILSLYRGCFKFIDSLNSNLRIDNRIGIYELSDNFSKIIRIYQEDVYYYICELSKTNKRSKVYKITSKLRENISHIYLFVVDDKDAVMKCILQEIDIKDFEYYSWKCLSDESLDYLEKLQKDLDELAYQMNYFNRRKAKNKTEGDSDAD